MPRLGPRNTSREHCTYQTLPRDSLAHLQEAILTPRTRPGNLVVGGGGRGIKKAPKHLGIGEWEVLKGKDDPVGKVYVRKGPTVEKQIDKATKEA